MGVSKLSLFITCRFCLVLVQLPTGILVELSWSIECVLVVWWTETCRWTSQNMSASDGSTVDVPRWTSYCVEA